MTIVLSLTAMIACIYVLSLITDGFFIEALDEISTKLKLPNSVAGASLMAMGSSAPELAIALFALFGSGGSHSDIGIGTIVGSAVFNILVITGASALVRPAAVRFKVVLRDTVVYLASIGLLLWAFADGSIQLIEAIAFLVLYVGYIILLLTWKVDEVEVADHTVDEEIAEVVRGGVFSVLPKLFGLFAGDPKKSYVRAFIVSILAIGGLCYVLVEAALEFAGAVGLPPVVVALTLLAGGTSVPDMISSIVVSRQGRGEMAVANAVGSNIFDILICLGLPWLIALTMLGQEIKVGTDELLASTVTLLATVLLLLIFLFTGRQLSRVEGGILVATYVGYVSYIYYTA